MRVPAWTAEAMGTFLLVFVGCGAIAIDHAAGTLGALGIAVAFGGILALSIPLLHGASGAHFNPAVTGLMAVLGHLPQRQVPVYVGAQLAGAILAGILLRALGVGAGEVGTTQFHGTVMQGLGVEVAATLGLLGVIVAFMRRHPVALGIAVGVWVAIMSVLVGPLTGASMNLARTLGPAIAAWDLQGVWLYALASFAALTLFAGTSILRARSLTGAGA